MSFQIMTIVVVVVAAAAVVEHKLRLQYNNC